MKQSNFNTVIKNMRSFNQKTKIDLPNIKRRHAYKNTESKADYFNLLFENSSDAESIRFENIRQRRKFLQSYHFYLAIAFILFVTACFLVVQMVVNSPEIEKYKAVTKNIEDIENNN
ncbi:MAG: hypothetical protein A3F80_04495 [Candidatus Melainabacteria bacterium RIFCSPLOWO2_12_FULL_35_11]|nr:MAG: hypothetical protein A3F80_04495 [Candidatus Melainabacteria bacterium RIFCSPLOWO2_12_FULL_35_11]